jgi:hypothetical protein
MTLPSDQLGTIICPNAVCLSGFQRTIRSSQTLPLMRSKRYAILDTAQQRAGEGDSAHEIERAQRP